MRAAVLGIAAHTALGDLSETLASLDADQRGFCDAPPYDPDGLSTPACARIAALDRDRPAEHLLMGVVAAALADVPLPAGARVALVVGTSSGNIAGPWERWHQAQVTGAPIDIDGIGRDTPTRVVAEALGLAPHATLSMACVSSTAALALAQGWLADEVADAVVVAGVDALCRYVHAGFSSLGALTASRPRPFHADRDGLLPGEGAAAIVLAPDGPDVWLAGTAVASDARHLTAPDRGGRGAIAAIRGAVGGRPVDLVSLHGTGTVFNDAAEVCALEAAFPDRDVAPHGVKHGIGHTMGAAGAIEAAILVAALRRGRPPPAPCPPAADGSDPAPRIRNFRRGGTPRSGLSLSAAFGGLNASAYFTLDPSGGASPRIPVRRADVEITVDADPRWDTLWPHAPAWSQRQNRYVRTVLLAIARLVDTAGSLHPQTALVLATDTGCGIADRAHHERLVLEGARRVSRLAFTGTVVHAPIAAATLLWHLRGPQIALVGPGSDAHGEARRWVARHDAPAAVAIEVEAPETGAPSRATATLYAAEDP